MVYRLPPETAELKPGPGVETAIVCQACHSADYISTQPSGKGKAFWQAEVQKMIKVYEAPIGEDDAAVIANYLARDLLSADATPHTFLRRDLAKVSKATASTMMTPMMICWM